VICGDLWKSSLLNDANGVARREVQARIRNESPVILMEGKHLEPVNCWKDYNTIRDDSGTCRFESRRVLHPTQVRGHIFLPTGSVQT
jgi:hypothetical protein